MSAGILSDCCGAPVRAEGRTTQWYACTGCGKPCNWHYLDAPPGEADNDYSS